MHSHTTLPLIKGDRAAGAGHIASVSGMPVATGRFPNGLDLVVISDRRAPIATHMVVYRHGSADDPAGQSGLAHFLEHLMFKGTPRYPAGEITRLLAAHGGEENAFTSQDYTAYYQQVPSDQLSLCMEYEADRMCGLVLSDEDIDTERDVVLEERMMDSEASPRGLLMEAVAIAAMPGHPSGRPIIGWQHEIRNYTRDAVMDLYRRVYRPDNAIVVVVGDVEVEEAFQLAARHYGAIVPPAVPLLQRLRPANPAIHAHRQVELTDPNEQQHQLFRMHPAPTSRVAVPGTAEALDLLAYLLGGDRRSYLYRRLVANRALAVDLSVNYRPIGFDQSRFVISSTPADGVTPQALDQAVDEELDKLRSDFFSAEAITRAKTQIIANRRYGLDGQISLAGHYGLALACGYTLEDIKAVPDRLWAVTEDDLRGVLDYLSRQFATSGYLIGSAAAAC